MISEFILVILFSIGVSSELAYIRNATQGVTTRIPCGLLPGVKNKKVIMEEVTWFKDELRILK